MSLVDEISENRRKIASDGYPISLGEVVNMYIEGDLDIHPEFQRIFRWSNSQKSKLIESILLGIPLPSFFVSQREDGIWDVVDGLQRLATILSFMGLYKDENNTTSPPLELEKTTYLPLLSGITWEGDNPLPLEIKRDFKRYKLDFKIIKKESDASAKYDLFQRLNTGGSSLQGQEVRDCLLIMINPLAYDFIKELAEVSSFIACTPMTDRKEGEKYRHELVLRFFIYKNLLSDTERAKEYSDVDSFLSTEMANMFSVGSDFDYQTEKDFFIEFFSELESVLGDDAFKTYDEARYKGGLILSRYEWICSYYCALDDTVDIKIQKLVDDSKILDNIPGFAEATRHGQKSLNRTVNLILSAKDYSED
jgi:hypothetical protein